MIVTLQVQYTQEVLSTCFGVLAEIIDKDTVSMF